MAYNLGEASMERLRTCDERIQRVIKRAIQITPIDFTVIEGHRTLERQRQLYDLKATKVLEGKHNENPSLAVDIAPYPIDWQDLRRFYVVAGVILSVAANYRIPLRWGGDWSGDGDFNDQTFHDLPHFEII